MRYSINVQINDLLSTDIKKTIFYSIHVYFPKIYLIYHIKFDLSFY